MSCTRLVLPLPEFDIETDAGSGIVCKLASERAYEIDLHSRRAALSAAASAFAMARAMRAIAHASIRISQGR